MSSKIIQRRSCSDRLIKRTKKITNLCFEKTVKEIMGQNSFEEGYDVEDFKTDLRMWRMRSFFGSPPIIKNIEELQEQVDELYLIKVCELPSQDLQDIIYIHEQGKYKRAPRTLEAISAELARRAIFEDTSESESKKSSNGGGVTNEQPNDSKPSKSSRKRKRKSNKSGSGDGLY